MKRKILRIAERTHAITLPTRWMDSHKLSKGDVIEVDSKNKNLILSINKEEEITVNIEKCNTQFIIKAIVSAYTFGYDIVKLVYSEKSLDVKQEKKVDTMDIIEETVNQLIGFEIVSRKGKICVLKDVSGFNGEEFKILLRRTFLMLNEFGRSSFHNAKEKKSEDLIGMHRCVRKFVNYLKRTLNKYGKSSKTLAYNDLLNALLWISTSLRMISKEERKYSSQALRWFNDVVLLFDEAYKNFYEFNEEKSSEILDKRKRILNSFDLKNVDDAVLSQRLAVILNSIYDIVDCSTEIKFEGKD